MKTTTGVAMPSFSPLSTLSARRSRPGDSPVVDHLHAESGVGRGERSTDEAGERPREAVEEHRGQETTEHHRQRKADGEQPRRDREVAPQLREVHPGRIREQHQGQSDLSEDVDRRGFDVNGERSPIRVPEDVARDREHEWTGDIVTRPRTRDERPAQDQKRNDRNCRLGHGAILSHRDRACEFQ